MSDGICPICKHPKVVPLGPNGYCEGYHEKRFNKKKKAVFEPIKQKSEKQSSVDVLYAMEAKKFKKKYPYCQVMQEGCTRITEDVHHGYSGMNRQKYQLDTSTWFATCRNCHDKIHNTMSAAEAKRLGLKLSESAESE